MVYTGSIEDVNIINEYKKVIEGKRYCVVTFLKSKSKTII
jgi:hypothetical protein